MKLVKLSLKNIKKSFKDYAIYFFTLILGVAIFYVFNAIESQTVLLSVTSSTKELIKLMVNMLSGVSVFVSFILGFLIIYASRFLIKRRNREFGIYLTLGMSKKKISTILFFETLFIGIISLLLGLGLGIIVSQFMSLLVANMFEANMTQFSFIFSKEACLKTIIYFGIMYILVMLFNTFVISKCKLIDLLHSEKLNEEVKINHPLISIVIFIIAVGLLSKAYYMVTVGFHDLQEAKQILIPIALGSVSTFLIFWSLSGLILKVVVSLKKYYYRGLNCFTLRQFSSKINTMVFSMTIICLMLFVTICVLASSLSIKNSLSKNLDELAPAELELYKKLESDNRNVLETLKNNGIDVTDYLDSYIELNAYRISGLTLGKTLGSKMNDVAKNYKFLAFSMEETVLRIGDYNRLAAFYGKETYDLSNDEYMIIADFDSLVKIRNEGLKNGETIEVGEKILKPKYAECQNGFLDLASNHINGGIIVIPDELLTDEQRIENYIIGNYKKSLNRQEKRNFEESLEDLKRQNVSQSTALPSINSRLQIAEASIGLGAMVTFIGLYLGIIFLIASAAILALKELSESTDNKERFALLRKIGVDEKMINKALFNQTAIFFSTPLVLALIHSIFGMKFSILILESIGTKGLFTSIVMTVAFLLIIYGGYFTITYYCSKNIIKSR